VEILLSQPRKQHSRPNWTFLAQGLLRQVHPRWRPSRADDRLCRKQSRKGGACSNR